MEPPLSSNFHHTRWATVAASAFYPNILDLRENEEVIRNLDIYFHSFIKGLQHDFLSY
jgi:hypothetical protein